MGKWLSQLQKNTKTPIDDTDKTDKTPAGTVLSVLSAPCCGVSENLPRKSVSGAGGFVSFVSEPTGAFAISTKELCHAAPS